MGAVVNLVYKKRDYNSKWFQPRTFEKKLYKILKVKKWKEKVPTWSPESFEMKSHTLSEIAEGMCGAEIVHEVIAVLSFVPVLFSLEFGIPAVFIITSILAATTDDEAAMTKFEEYGMPYSVKMTLHGATNETYKKVCNSDCGFSKVENAVRL